MRPLFEILGRWPAWEDAAIRHGLAAWVADELSAAAQPVPASVMRRAMVMSLVVFTEPLSRRARKRKATARKVTTESRMSVTTRAMPRWSWRSAPVPGRCGAIMA